MPIETLVIHGPDSLGPLLAGRARGRVEVAAPALDPAEQARWTDRLNRHARACGCEAGARAMLAVLLAYAGAAAIGMDPLPASVVGRVLLGVPVVLAAAAAGKVLGVFAARRRLAAEARRLLDALGG